MRRRPGARRLDGDRWSFVVWAPEHERVSVRIGAADGGRAGAPDGADARAVDLTATERGYFEGGIDGLRHGDRYGVALDGGEELPDPASRWQPDGVHGASALVDLAADARSPAGWFGLPLERYVLYELHVGTFTPDGTFDAAVPYLDGLAALGVTAIELMPVAAFPGRRNWGYDGVFPFAVQESYGGPVGLARFVDACHERGMCAVLDVVYNHLGPEGNILGRFGPYFTDRYSTPWGDAINVDGPGSDEVRDYLIANAMQWLGEYGFDALRLDAIHGIVDTSATPFLAELSAAVGDLAIETNRRLFLIAESDLNDVRVLRSRDQLGLGMDAQWSDDLHHAIHARLTGESTGYYEDFGTLEDVATAERRSFVYAGRRSAHRGRRHGNRPDGAGGRSFVVFAQNHDQVGNRALGDRLTELVDAASARLAAAAVLLSPFVPLLFMGEEYGETAPFRYFVDHTDPELREAVRRGRAEEFRRFAWGEDVPDPGEERTFADSTLDHRLAGERSHARVLELHRELLRLRRELPALRALDLEAVTTEVDAQAEAVVIRRTCDEAAAMLVLAFATERRELHRAFAGRWRCVLDTNDERWGGTGTPSQAQPLEVDAGGGAVPLSPRTALLFSEDVP
jgi:maltooligosyltrehalose trehalohydrolase